MKDKNLTKKSEKFDSIIVIRLPKLMKDKMLKIAKSMGLNVSALARMWLMEKYQAIK